jgi:hypothetical protein
MVINENLDEEYNKKIMDLSDKTINYLYNSKIHDCKYSQTNIVLNILLISLAKMLYVCFPDELRELCIEKAIFQIKENVKLFESKGAPK